MKRRDPAEIAHRLLPELLWVVVVSIAVLWALLPISPRNMNYTTRDSAVFMYTGWRINQGEIPYRDVWDHKPPLVFFINSIGELLTPDSSWGIWGIEVLSLFISFFLIARLLQRIFGHIPAALALFWLATQTTLQIWGGNLTTEYALPFQVGTLWLAYQAEKKGELSWRGLLIGILLGCAFFLKQVTVGIGLALVMYLFITRLWNKQVRRFVVECGWILGGFILVTGVVIGYFWVFHALPEFLDAAFRYNYYYAKPSLTGSLHVISGIQTSLSMTGLWFFAVVGWTVFIGAIVSNLAQLRKPDIKSSVLLISFLDLPLELILVSSAGRGTEHYYLTILPVFAVFSAYFLSLLLEGARAAFPKTTPTRLRWIASVCVCLAFTLTQVPVVKNYRASVVWFHNLSYPWAVIQYIDASTQPDDEVLVLGAETYINFATRRVSPTRFVYQFPLYRSGYTTTGMVEEFLSDIVTRRPSVIIDTEDYFTFDSFPVNSPEISRLIQEVHEQYSLIRTVDPGFSIYQPTPDE